MTIERQYGKIIFTCDVENSAQCEEQVETGKTGFVAALQAMKEEGWTPFSLDGTTWQHCCSECEVPDGA